jgi:hypothetical protein
MTDAKVKARSYWGRHDEEEGDRRRRLMTDES